MDADLLQRRLAFVKRVWPNATDTELIACTSFLYRLDAAGCHVELPSDDGEGDTQ